jgi:hypothetical protein
VPSPPPYPLPNTSSTSLPCPPSNGFWKRHLQSLSPPLLLLPGQPLTRLSHWSFSIFRAILVEITLANLGIGWCMDCRFMQNSGQSCEPNCGSLLDLLSFYLPWMNFCKIGLNWGWVVGCEQGSYRANRKFDMSMSYEFQTTILNSIEDVWPS